MPSDKANFDPKLTHLSPWFAILIATAISASADAATMEQAVALCREQVRPIAHECVVQKMRAAGSRNRDPFMAECKAAVMPQARACVVRLIGAAGFKQSPIEAAYDRGSSNTAKVVSRPTSAPPRTIADITAILDQEKPDPMRLKRLRDAADALPPGRSDAIALAHFYHNRAVVRSELGRFRDALADGERSVQLATGKVDQLVTSDFRITLALQYNAIGEPKLALAQILKMASDGEHGERGFLFAAYRQIVEANLMLGNFDTAQSYVLKLQTLWKGASSIRGQNEHAKSREALVEEAQARLFEARGQLDDALRAYQHAENLRRAGIDSSATAVIALPRNQLEYWADATLLASARVKSRLGRLAEAEADARRALLNRLTATGKYNPQTANFIAALGALLIEQGRYEDAKKLISATIDIYRQLGVAEDSQTFIAALSNLALVQALEGRWADAGETYAAVERATQSWEAGRREGVLLTHGYIETLYKTKRIDAGLAAARRLLEITSAHLGDQNPDTALARGHYAVGLLQAGRESEAGKEFQAAIPQLTSATFNTDNDDVLNAAARTRYTQVVIESYIAMLEHSRSTVAGDVSSEAFQLADTIRGRAVQKALTASGARISVSDPALAAAVRQEQDLRQQIGTQLGELNNLLSLPAAERDDAGVSAFRSQIEKMRSDHTRVRADIDRRFPAYANLIDPKPPNIDQIRHTLRPDEALLAFYFGQDASFVWAVPKEGAVVFAAVPLTASGLETKIRVLRQALEPQVTMVSEIPPFDPALAYELYALMLKPVEAGWKGAKSLIVVTNGALGELPLSLLPTAPSHIDLEAKPLFAGYRDVPWLARTQATTTIPSASALITLRQLPQGSAGRDKLIGFGDPYFNAQEAAEAEEQAPEETQLASDSETASTRGMLLKLRASPHTENVDAAELAMLPRLPDTRLELLSVAKALHVDPAKALYLGKAANEQNVETMNLAHYRIVEFATHGLIPGDLDGLTQPALALTAPEIAGVKGDGLLTTDKILALKLDADWVVLSACNTAAGAGAGAEAASGLGRAFFYAGTRAILVTNWSVHSASARELVSDLFHREVADAKLSRAEALRQAMMALLDGKGLTDKSGKTVFSYGHPLFWAPYTIIGDGG